MRFILLLLTLVLNLTLVAQGFNQISTGLFRLGSFAVADYNGDGRQDVFGYQFFFSGNSNVALQLNDGNTPAAFAERALGFDLGVTGRPTAADFDGDGDFDLACTLAEGQEIVFLKNDGNATFTIDSSEALAFGGLLEAADFEADGLPDLVSLNPANNRLTFHRNTTSGWTSEILIENNTDLDYLRLADIDQDGDMDILPGYDGGTTRVGLFQNDGGGNFTAIDMIVNQGPFVDLMEIGDINGDERPDIYTAHRFASDVRAYVNQGNLSFELVSLGVPPGIIRSILPADFDGDGREDFAVGTNSEGIVWFKNLGTSPITTERFEVGGVSPAFTLNQIDLENDGDVDILASNSEFWFYENTLTQGPNTTSELFLKPPKIHPNPVSQSLNITLSSASPSHYAITDTSGRMVETGLVIANSIAVLNLPAGHYFLQLFDPTGRAYEPVKFNKF